MSKVLIPMIDGFEEIEAISVIDILRRAGAVVTTAGIGKQEAMGSHEVHVRTDVVLQDVINEHFDAIVLPGGPGSGELANVASLRQMVLEHADRGVLLAAICAAPAVLAAFGLLAGKRVACFPSVEGCLGGATVVHEPVVSDGNLITSRGAGTAIPFALEIVKAVYGKSRADEIAHSIIYTSGAG